MKKRENTMMTKADKIKQILEQNGSKLCSVEFTKKDGSIRVMQVQLRSKKGVKGESASEQAKKAVESRKKNNPDLINVVDVQLRKKGVTESACWRSFNADTVLRIKADGVEYKFS